MEKKPLFYMIKEWLSYSTKKEVHLMTEELKPAIELKDVSFSDEDTSIIKQITGVFYEGKITTLVGPSGAGKTTLFKLCNGLIQPDTGNIYIKGQPIGSYEPQQLRRTVGIALQNATMIPGHVMENLTLPLRLQDKQLSEETAIHLLHDVGLEESLLYRDVSDLSGGQRQKVSIARTLVNQSPILLLDEITSSLDRVSRRDMEELIVKINKKYGTTIVWITHSIDQALNIGDFAWVLMNGELVESGEVSFLNNPSNSRVRSFLKEELE
jgi:putative ABC transport system ATP-binding protein